MQTDFASALSAFRANTHEQADSVAAQTPAPPPQGDHEQHPELPCQGFSIGEM
jgi:hypothetical protein